MSETGVTLTLCEIRRIMAAIRTRRDAEMLRAAKPYDDLLAGARALLDALGETEQTDQEQSA